jgi:dihydrofolate synthase/folylpolyglutamate synthase
MNPFLTESDHDAAKQFLCSRIDYERATAIPYDKRDFKLDRMVRFLARLGNPQVGLNIVHIAGTKGKGSTAAMIASVLTAAGYRTGLYTSPHLERVEERLRIDSTICPDDDFIQLIERIRPVVEELDAVAAEELPPSHGPTYFEIITAMALVYFADQRVDWAVLEVGLGGRLDSTNVCQPAVSVITSISFDHTKQLGDTLAAIAGEKAGIIKPGVPVVSGVVEDEPRAVIRQMAAQHGCRLVERGVGFDVIYRPKEHASALSRSSMDFEYRVPRRERSLEDVEISLLGPHQAANAGVALATLEELCLQGWHIDEADVRRGLASMHWPARVEVISHRPTVVLDAAHNLASVAALVETLEQSFTARKRILIFATTRDKDARGMLKLLLSKFNTVLLTRYQNNPRGLTIDELATLAEESSSKNWLKCPTSTEAWRRARDFATPDDLIVITGSFFIAAEFGAIVRNDTSSCSSTSHRANDHVAANENPDRGSRTP